MDLTENRIGRFFVDHELAHLHTKDVMAVMSEMFVVRAELVFTCNAIEYTAYCDKFDPVPPGNEPPVYLPIMRKDIDKATGETKVTMVKLQRMRDHETV